MTSNIRTTITVKKEFELAEDQLEALLQAHGALRFGCDANKVQVHIQISSSGSYVQSVTLSTESEVVEES